MEPPAATPFEDQVWEKFQTRVVFGPVDEAKWFSACVELDIPSVLIAKDENQAMMHLKNNLGNCA